MKKSEMQSDGVDLFVVVDGVKIAKRGRPGIHHAKTWISLEPGWSVLDIDHEDEEQGAIEITHEGVRIH